MLIILEGADGVGKTTFANLLRERLGAATPLHCGPLETDPITEYTGGIQWYRPGSGVDVICDRWHWGEEVYGPKYRGESKFSLASWSHVEKTLMVRGAVVAFLGGDPTEIANRLNTRGDDMVASTDVLDLIARYYDVAASSELPWFQYVNPTEDDADDLLLMARIAEMTAKVLNPFPSYAGSVSPHYLFIADRDQWAGSFEAALTPFPDTPSSFLLDTMFITLLREVGVANTNEDVRALWDTLGRPLVVALGAPADIACTEAGIKHGTAPNPTHIWRYHPEAQEAYGEVVRDALKNGKDNLTWRP